MSSGTQCSKVDHKDNFPYFLSLYWKKVYNIIQKEEYVMRM